MNAKLINFIKVLKQFAGDNKKYWIMQSKDLCNAEKGFLIIYFNLL